MFTVILNEGWCSGRAGLGVGSNPGHRCLERALPPGYGRNIRVPPLEILQEHTRVAIYRSPSQFHWLVALLAFVVKASTLIENIK